MAEISKQERIPCIFNSVKSISPSFVHGWGLVLAILGAIACSGISLAAPITSVYTGLTPSACKKSQAEAEPEGVVHACPGLAGYTLLVEEADSRASVTVVTPSKKEFPLRFRETVTKAFNTLGTKAEWRVRSTQKKIIPLGMTVRVDAALDVGTVTKTISFLVVTKLTNESVCVIAKIPLRRGSKSLARQKADTSTGQPCVQTALSSHTKDK